MKTSDVLKKAKISRATLMRWIKSGDFMPPSKKTNRAHEYEWSEFYLEKLMQFINEKQNKK